MSAADVETIREALNDLYHYTSELHNRHGGRSETWGAGLKAATRLEALALRAEQAEQRAKNAVAERLKWEAETHRLEDLALRGEWLEERPEQPILNAARRLVLATDNAERNAALGDLHNALATPEGLEELERIATDWRYSDEFVGQAARRIWPPDYDFVAATPEEERDER